MFSPAYVDRPYADPIHAGPGHVRYRAAVAAVWAKFQQSHRECPDCCRTIIECRCGGGSG